MTLMSSRFEERVEALRAAFLPLATPEARYHYLIELGRALPPYDPLLKTPDRLVPGCQSTLYLASHFDNQNLYFTAFSDALISAGLAALLLQIYSGLPPEVILRKPPTFLRDLPILTSLSPSRSNGLAHLHLRLKQEAIKTLPFVE